MKTRHLLTISLLVTVSSAAQAFDCRPPSAGLPDIKAFKYYSDAAGSIRDEAKFKATHALTKPFEDFARQVATLSDVYLATQDAGAAQCAIDWLDRWAQDGAMLGRMIIVDNGQPEYVRKWTNASAAVSWLKLRRLADAPQRERIDDWLKKVSQATLDYWRHNPKRTRNNHYYWTGVGVMATAVATGDKDLLDAARSIYTAGLNDIDNDGALREEMRRGVRALHYHNYSAMPLVMTAEMARKLDQDWFSLRDNRLDKLAQFIAKGIRHPDWMGDLARATPQLMPSASDRAWMLIYRSRVPNGERFEGLYADDKSAFVRDLGGDLRLMLAHDIFSPQAAN